MQTHTGPIASIGPRKWSLVSHFITTTVVAL